MTEPLRDLMLTYQKIVEELIVAHNEKARLNNELTIAKALVLSLELRHRMLEEQIKTEKKLMGLDK